MRSHPWHRSTVLRCLAAWCKCPLHGFGASCIQSFCSSILPVATRSLRHKLSSAFMWARSGFRSVCCTMAGDGSDRETWSPDSDRIDREAAANGHPPWMMVAPVTPGGTPLPRGPPPPRPVQEQRDIALHMSRAVVQAFNERGVTIRTALTLLPEYWWNLQGVHIRIDPLTPGHSFHLNLLTIEDDPPKPAIEEGEGRAEGRADAHREEHNREDQVDSSQESGSETDLRAMGSTSDSVSGTALLAAPRGPWHVNTAAAAKPKTSRKLGPHLLPCSFALMEYIVLLCVLSGLGVADLIERSRNVYRSCCHRDLSPLHPRRQLDVKCQCSHSE